MLPGECAPEVIDPEKPALQDVLPNPHGLGRSDPARAHLRRPSSPAVQPLLLRRSAAPRFGILFISLFSPFPSYPTSLSLSSSTRLLPYFLSSSIFYLLPSYFSPFFFYYLLLPPTSFFSYYFPLFSLSFLLHFLIEDYSDY